MKTRHILFALLCIFLFGACHSPQTGVYNIMDYGATGDGKPMTPQPFRKLSTLVRKQAEEQCLFHPDIHFFADHLS